MIDHDPVCLTFQAIDGTYECRCSVVMAARADEREKIAQAIEEAIPPGDGPWAHSVYREAARIVRSGGKIDN